MKMPGQLVLVSLLFATSAPAEIALIGTCSIPGDALDRSGLSGVIGKDIPVSRLGSFGSAIDYTGKDDLYVACDDRGPGNGELPWPCRFQTFRISIKPGTDEPVRVELISTTLLRNEDGAILTGLATAFSSTDHRLSARFDAEGIRISGRGTLFVSDEYGPWIDEFAMDGRRMRRFGVPARFMVEHPSGDPQQELDDNACGRQPNRGFEGLAISPDKTKLWALPQSPLLQDNAVASEGGQEKRVGINCRMLELDIASGRTRELVYQLASHKHGLNELLALDGTRMLVIERDGESARSRALYRIDTAGATDVSGIEELPRATLPDRVRPVAKTLWLDFMDPRFGLAKDMPEKIEGLTLGPTLPDGRRTLVVTTDNDLLADQPSRFWVFAFQPNDLIPGGASAPGAAQKR